jgi:hypothetical protein
MKTLAMLGFALAVFSASCASAVTSPSAEAGPLTVKFYAIDREKVNKGEYLGFAELDEEGTYKVEVTDPKLETILKSPYTTMSGNGCSGGVCKDWQVTYQPGTRKHLTAIAIECYRFGYIGEIVSS